MSSFFTPNRHGYNVRFCPFDADILAVVSSQYYGLCGAGTLFLLEKTANGLEEIGQTKWTDGLFDLVWSPANEKVVATASGDGTLQLWNLNSMEDGVPIAHLLAHQDEVYSIDWGNSHCRKNLLSASWDKTIKLWDSTSLHVGADGMLAIWSSTMTKPCMKLMAHDGEVLTCAWSKFDSNLIATGASDGLIRGWDLRNLSGSIFELYGCEYAVRRIQFSPHVEDVLVSAAYDFGTRVWNYRLQPEPIETIVHHSEFVYGIDCNANRVGEIADCGWDSLVHVFTPLSLKNE